MADMIKMAIRTAAQGAAGAVATWLMTSGYDVDETGLVVLLVAVFSAAWAALSRVLAERVHPMFGLLSLIPSQPVYGDDSGGR